MPLVSEKDKFPAMPSITLYRLVSRSEGVVIRFSGLGDHVDETVQAVMAESVAVTDGFDGFLEALTRARYVHDGRPTRFHVVAENVPDEHITWHRERIVECHDVGDDEAGVATYCLLTI